MSNAATDNITIYYVLLLFKTCINLTVLINHIIVVISFGCFLLKHSLFLISLIFVIIITIIKKLLAGLSFL